MSGSRFGKTPPRIAHLPSSRRTARGNAAIKLAEKAGLILDPWQKGALRAMCSLRSDGLWSAFEFGLNVPRQNGKGGVLEARELAGLFEFGEGLLIHTAHEFATSSEHFRRVQSLIENTPDLHDQVKRNDFGRVTGYRHSHGEESIELANGARVLFRTRTKGGGRGFAAADFIAFDEAMYLPDAMLAALIPILSSRSVPTDGGTGPQVSYTGSAVDQEIHDQGIAFTRVRERGILGEDERLAYLEWSVDAELPSEVGEVTDAMIAQANPALGIRISPQYVKEFEQDALSERSFATERLGVGDYPATDGGAGGPIDIERWTSLIDESSRPLDPVCLAADVSPDRRASIAAAGRRADGRLHVEVTDNRSGTSWLPSRLAELVDRHEPAVLKLDAFGPAASVLHDIEEAGVTIDSVNGSEVARACGRLLDAVNEGQLRHLGSAELDNAIKAARTRPLGDAWAWSRRNSSEDISPLVAATLAVSAAIDQPEGGDLEIF